MSVSRIELTISNKYVAEWGVLEGVRELIQNGMDAKEDGDMFVVRYDKKQAELIIENTGTRLMKKTLLLGNTSKTGREGQRGKFGEGYKLGVMALIRQNRCVEIFTGNEKWTPVIAKSEKFDGEEVLCFDIECLGDEDFNGVKARISRIEEEEWKKICELILPENRNSYRCEFGEILLDEKYAGKVFVGGILVSGVQDLSLGYNLAPSQVQIDRDRKMVSSYSLFYETKKILESYALNGGMKKVTNMLSSGAADVYQFRYSTSYSDGFAKALADDFIAEHGANAFPVRSFDEGKRAAFVGKNAVYASDEYASVLISSLGNLNDMLQKFSRSVVTVYGREDLNEKENTNYDRCIKLLDRCGISSKCVKIVDFNDDNLHGLFDSGEVKIAKRMMNDWVELLSVLIHELSHFEGTDGTKRHTDKMDEIWKSVVREMWEMFEGRTANEGAEEIVEIRL